MSTEFDDDRTETDDDFRNWAEKALGAMLYAKERHRLSGKWRGRFSCKTCNNGIVHWRISAKNKHTAGQCTTPGCISWIE